MFFGCGSLSNISPLKSWNISNQLKFNECPSSSDFILAPYNFSSMFSGCLSLKDIKPLEKWNVSNGNNFSYMFYGCKNLKDVRSLEK